MNLSGISSVIMLRRAIYLALGMVDHALRRRNPLVVLCYHSFGADGWRFSVDAATMEKQIRYLKKSGYSFITLDDVLRHIRGKKIIRYPSVVITVDDGYKNVFKTKDFFRNQGIKPALFILSDSGHANRSELGSARPFLTAHEIRQLKKEGWTIGCHSATHANLTRLHQNQLEKEVRESKKNIEKELTADIDYFAYPKGKYNTAVLQAVRISGYTLGLSMDDGVITQKTDPLVLPRIGVDRSHSFNEFKALFSPSVILFRKLVKKTLGENIL